MKITRKDIQIIGRHSNLSEESIEHLLVEHVYNNKAIWTKFLKLFFMSLGVSFITAGIIFFFAYNWADLHKFTKIGLVEALIVITTLAVLLSKLSLNIKNILLTAASMLVGVLFAVFGQIYQTGANAYDFFLGWTAAIALWVVVSNFAPLWLLFILLIQTTLVLYTQQVAHDWSDGDLRILILVVNALFLIGALLTKKVNTSDPAPTWFVNVLALATVIWSTTTVVTGILGKSDFSFTILLMLTAVLYSAGIWYGLKTKSGFFLSIIPFSFIIMACAALIEFSNDEGMILFICLFVIASVTLVIKTLLTLQKKWNSK